MEEAKELGRDLADRACSLIREEGGSAADIATLFWRWRSALSRWKQKA
jgi:hypothetical protein